MSACSFIAFSVSINSSYFHLFRPQTLESDVPLSLCHLTSNLLVNSAASTFRMCPEPSPSCPCGVILIKLPGLCGCQGSYNALLYNTEKSAAIHAYTLSLSFLAIWSPSPHPTPHASFLWFHVVFLSLLLSQPSPSCILHQAHVQTGSLLPFFFWLNMLLQDDCMLAFLIQPGLLHEYPLITSNHLPILCPFFFFPPLIYSYYLRCQCNFIHLLIALPRHPSFPLRSWHSTSYMHNLLNKMSY